MSALISYQTFTQLSFPKIGVCWQHLLQTLLQPIRKTFLIVVTVFHGFSRARNLFQPQISESDNKHQETTPLSGPPS